MLTIRCTLNVKTSSEGMQVVQGVSKDNPARKWVTMTIFTLAGLLVCGPLGAAVGLIIGLLWRRPLSLRAGTITLGFFIGAALGYLLGYINRPSYAFGYRPPLDEILENSSMRSDFLAVIAAWAIGCGIGGDVVGALLMSLGSLSRDSVS